MINSKYISVGVTLISSGMIFNNNSHFNPRKLSFENKNIIETSLRAGAAWDADYKTKQGVGGRMKNKMPTGHFVSGVANWMQICVIRFSLYLHLELWMESFLILRSREIFGHVVTRKTNISSMCIGLDSTVYLLWWWEKWIVLIKLYDPAVISNYLQQNN